MTLTLLEITLQFIFSHSVLLKELINKLRSFLLIALRHVCSAGLLKISVLKVSILVLRYMNLLKPDVDRRYRLHKSLLLSRTLELTRRNIALSQLAFVFDFAAVSSVQIPLILLRYRML